MILLAVLFVSSALVQLRWLRVAQREHYLAGSTTTFAFRWWRSSAYNAVAFVLMLLCFGASLVFPYAALGMALIAVFTPARLSLRGRTSRLSWTRRLRLLAMTTALLWVGIVAVFALALSLPAGERAGAVVLFFSPLLIDIALVITRPIERRFGDRFVTLATKRLQRVAPTVIAITGSYGKTTTKGYIAHLLSKDHAVLASPRSYNNRAGLAKTVNEMLDPGTEIFIAEMGTYGPGEIASLCSWIRPTISVLTAIGPVHLERFKELSVTLSSKAEIAQHASTVVLNVDDPYLASLIEPLQQEGKRVITCSATDISADVCLRVEDGFVRLYVEGSAIAGRAIAEDLRPAAMTNVACAFGAVLAIGDDLSRLVDEIEGLPGAPNRLSQTTGESGVTILDDTFNANPAGAELALGRLATIGTPTGRRVLVTPGMIELGHKQQLENRRLAKRASSICSDIVIVGRTNRRALRSGCEDDVHVVLAGDREEAVAWVKSNLAAGDTVLYENDLPDHYA